MDYPPRHAPERSGVRSGGVQDLAIRLSNNPPLSADQLPLPASGGDTPSAAFSGFLSNSQHPNIGSGTFNHVSGSQYNISSFGERRSVTPSIQRSSSNDVPGQGSTQPLPESALGPPSTLHAQHPAMQSTVSALKSEASSTLESLVQAPQIQIQSSAHEVALARREQLEARPLPPQELAQECKSLMQMLNEWKDIDGQWNAVKEEWSQECERLSEARGERQLYSLDSSKSEHPDPPEDWNTLGASTAMGVLVLSIAAAALLWPE